jgi:hypothetical protein
MKKATKIIADIGKGIMTDRWVLAWGCWSTLIASGHVYG